MRAPPQSVLMQLSTRCLASLGQFSAVGGTALNSTATVCCLPSQQQHHQQQQQMCSLQPLNAPTQPLLPHRAPWGGATNLSNSSGSGSSIFALSASRRGFLSSILQPESKVYKERRLIGYSPEQLYEVVSQVQHYSAFVPWCVGSTILKQQQDGRYLEAELQIGFQMISERYTSKVTLHPPNRVSSTVADSALFHHLESTWQMTPGPSPNSTWLSFSVDFAFLNPLYANVAQLFFSEVVTRMMGAFEGRCKQLYGQPSFLSPGGVGVGGSGRRSQHHAQQVVVPHHVPAATLGHHQQHQHQQHQQQQLQQPSPAVAGTTAAEVDVGGGGGGGCHQHHHHQHHHHSEQQQRQQRQQIVQSSSVGSK